jgi:hypothetical protein
MNDRIDQTPWDGNWKFRLKDRLRSLGFQSLKAYLGANPTLGYERIVTTLNCNICAMQIYGLQLRSASDVPEFRRQCQDVLVRLINSGLRRGWNLGVNFGRNWIDVSVRYVSIVAFENNILKIEKLEEYLDSILAYIASACPPSGWLPSGVDDDLISNAFNAVWPTD